MKSAQEILNIMAHATGTERYHRISLVKNAPVATDGIAAVATAAGCFWLLDIVVSYQSDKRLDPNFQVWTLTVNRNDNSAVVRGHNDTELIIQQDIPFTDFPLDEFKLYVIDGVILLPSEY